MVLTVLGVVQVIACIVLIATVLLQKGASQGLGAVNGGADTFYGQHKSSGLDAILAKITTFFSVVFVIVSLVLSMLG